MPFLHRLHEPYLDRLKSAGITPDQVDFVFLTHLHVDRVGWNTQFINGRWVPTFPKAKYFMPNLEYRYFATSANREDPR
jgi:glyoxylase-like metal-dependent hydrolase (beta-lactamase superfamily II)